MTRPQVVFRCDATYEIGGGHVMRCLALADALTEVGWICRFASCEETASTVPTLTDRGLEIIQVSKNNDSGQTEFMASVPEGIDLLIVDHYELDATFEKNCRPWANRVVVIDDFPGRKHSADILVDQTLGRRPEDYAGLMPESALCLTGTKFAMLRPQFAAMRNATLKAREERWQSPTPRLMVSMGTTDPYNLTTGVLEAINELPKRVSADIILGPSAPHLNAVSERVATLNSKGRDLALHIGVSDMAGIMARADFSIGASGSTSWERCCMGLPALLIVDADNQTDIASALVAAGAAYSIDARSGIDWSDMTMVLADIVENYRLIKNMSGKAAELCDGMGTSRVASILNNIQQQKESCQ